MSLHCFTNLSYLPIRLHFFHCDRMDEYFLYSEMDIIRAKYADKYDILSVVVDDDYIHLTIYKPNDYVPM